MAQGKFREGSRNVRIIKKINQASQAERGWLEVYTAYPAIVKKLLAKFVNFGKIFYLWLMVSVAQLVRALGCGPRGRGFEPLHSPQFYCYPVGIFAVETI